MRELIIDPEFKSLLFPLSTEEYSQLKENILRDGCLEPLIVWGDILVDGHNRYQICTENGVEFSVTQKEFSGRDEVIEFILRTQLGRRNLSDFHKNKIALQYKDILAKKAKERQGTRTDLVAQDKTFASNGAKVERIDRNNRTDAQLGTIAGTSESSIRRTRTILEKGTPEQIERAEKGGKGNSINAIAQEIRQSEKGTQDKKQDPPKQVGKDLQVVYDGIEMVFNNYRDTVKNFIQDKRELLEGNSKELKALLLKEVQEIKNIVKEIK